MTAVLITHPYVGSLWLEHAKLNGDYVEGLAWDSTFSGDPYYPDDYSGEYQHMNFPKTCIRKVEGDPLEDA